MIYYVIIIDLITQEEYSAEIDKIHFPSENITYGTIFYIFHGETKKEENFFHIKLETRVWTPEMIDTAKKEADKILDLFNDKPLLTRDK